MTHETGSMGQLTDGELKYEQAQVHSNCVVGESGSNEALANLLEKKKKKNYKLLDGEKG